MNYTLEHALEYAKKRGHAAIMEKDGKYLTAKDFEERTYAETCGWTYVGHPADLMNGKGAK